MLPPLHLDIGIRRRWTGIKILLQGLMFLLIMPASVSAQAQSDAQAQAMPATYADRLIDDGKLEIATVSNDQQSRDGNGAMRSLIVEWGSANISARSLIDGQDLADLNSMKRETGVNVSGRYRTVNYGELGIDAQLRRGYPPQSAGGKSANSWNGSMTLTSRDMPLGDGWLATSAVGTTISPATDLVQKQTRFSLPATPLLGATATIEAYRKLPDTQTTGDPAPWAIFNLAVGEPGLLSGLRLSDYSGLSGRLISAGAQFEISPRWAAGFQAIDVSRTRDPFAEIDHSGLANDPIAKISARGAVATIAYTDKSLRIQANAISTVTHTNATSAEHIRKFGKAKGGWFDANYRTGRSTHSGGLYYFEPGLAWGTSTLIGNVYGAHYRLSTLSQRWRWTVNFDAFRSVNKGGSSGTIGNLDIQRKLDFQTTAGINGAVRSANGHTSIQLLGYIDKANRIGTFRADASLSREAGSRLIRAGFNQNWTLPARLPSGSRLSTQVFYEKQQQSEETICIPACSIKGKSGSFGAALTAGLMPISGFSLDATLAYQSNASSKSPHIYGPHDAFTGESTKQSRAFNASIVGNLRLSSQWSLTASYTDSTSNSYSSYGFSNSTPPLFGLTQMRRNSFHLRAGYLTLRYALSAGRPQAIAGQRQYPVGGAGNVEGRIFFDSNNNRLREASEAGVPGIVVILDGAHATRTDTAGYYRFDSVSDGPHRITLNSDALPLPWSIRKDDGAYNGTPYTAIINVGVRATATLDVPAIKEP